MKDSSDSIHDGNDGTTQQQQKSDTNKLSFVDNLTNQFPSMNSADFLIRQMSQRKNRNIHCNTFKSKNIRQKIILLLSHWPSQNGKYKK